MPVREPPSARRPPGADETPPGRALKVLIVEDSSDDLALLLIALRRAGYEPEYQRVQTAEELDEALQARRWDVVLSDYTLPDFSGLHALQHVHLSDPDMPFIIISGNIGEEIAVAAMKAGAQDYLLKGNLVRLGAAIERELREAENRRARRCDERELREAKQRLQALSSRMLQLQETERRHIARELHDEIGQTLTAIKLSLEALMQRTADPADRTVMSEIAGISAELLEKVRQLSLDLRPPHLDELGLSAALQWLLKRHARDGAPRIDLVAPPALQRPRMNIETACFRIAQEALTNVLRHASASEVCIRLDADDERFRLSVRDNGRGFDPASARTAALKGASLGLAGMEERVLLAGGTLSIRSAPGHGTEVEAAFPLTAENDPT